MLVSVLWSESRAGYSSCCWCHMTADSKRHRSRSRSLHQHQKHHHLSHINRFIIIIIIIIIINTSCCHKPASPEPEPASAPWVYILAEKYKITPNFFQILLILCHCCWFPIYSSQKSLFIPPCIDIWKNIDPCNNSSILTQRLIITRCYKWDYLFLQLIAS